MCEEKNLKLKLQQGEGFKVEFKEKIANLDREIVSFANASGGEIFLGVNDQGIIIGIKITNALKSQIHDIARNCDPSIQIIFKEYQEHSVLSIIIEEGENKPYKCKDGFFLRIGPNAQKLKRDEIIQFINDVGKIYFDETINTRFEYTKDFSHDALNTYLQHCNLKLENSPEDILMSLNIARYHQSTLKLTNTAVLFFSKNPQKFFPEAYVTAIKYQTNDRFSIIDRKDFKNNLISQIEESLIFIQRHINVTSPFKTIKNGQRIEFFDYPLIAIREAIVNAVTHRDYLYDGSHIYIHLFPEFIEIENPGGLYHGLKIEDLGRRSVRRNRLIADLLYRAHYIEQIGSGFDRMRITLSENKNPNLEVISNNFFNIRFFKRAAEFDIQNLTSRQLSIYYLFQERKTLSKREILNILNISEDTTIRELNTLIKKGLIIKQGHGKTTRYSLQQFPA